MKRKTKSSLEVNRDFWVNKFESERNKSFSRKFEDVDSDMNSKFCSAILDDAFEYLESNFYLTKTFKKFLSIVYDKNHDTRINHLELRDMGLMNPTLVLGIDADTVLINAREIQFALFVFIEEWYSNLEYSNIYLEWC